VIEPLNISWNTGRNECQGSNFMVMNIIENLNLFVGKSIELAVSTGVSSTSTKDPRPKLLLGGKHT